MKKIRLILLTISIFLFYGCEISDKRVEKPLKIKIVNDKPCFYIDPFEDMDKFNIQSISVGSKWNDIKWIEGYQIFASDFHRGIFRPIGNAFLFQPSAVSGSGKCIEYGINIVRKNGIEKELKVDSNYTDSNLIVLTAEINTALSPVDQIGLSDITILSPMAAKELKTDVVYSAGMHGWNKEQWDLPIKEVQVINFHVRFYLKKNIQTGKIEAVMVDNNITKTN